MVRQAVLATNMAPQAGFEPATNRLTADRSTTELLRSVNEEGLSTLADSVAPPSGDAQDANVPTPPVSRPIPHPHNSYEVHFWQGDETATSVIL